MTAAGEWRIGRSRPEHVYEGKGTEDPHDDLPVASFLGYAPVAESRAREAVVAVIPLSEDQVYRYTHTGETEDEIAAEVAAAWMSKALGVPD